MLWDHTSCLGMIRKHNLKGKEINCKMTIPFNKNFKYLLHEFNFIELTTLDRPK